MNRPKKEDTLTGRMYREALERYCDELEKQYNFTTLFNTKLAMDLFDRNGTIAELEKALDMACEIIETYDTKGNYAKLGWTKEKWKELVKNGKNGLKRSGIDGRKEE